MSKAFSVIDMIQQKIPVMFRVPIALVCDGLIAFGPIVLGFYFKKPQSSILFVIIPGILWIIIFDKFLLWRLDCFWNLKTRQNRTDKPEHPDNYREFKTIKGWIYWNFIGKDIEN
jgi:hypothetical protein